MKISNEKSIIIEGSKKSGFGTSIAAVGDIDGDGYPDILIGAPYLDSGYAALLPGKKKYKEIESISLAKIILTGKNYRDRFGYSLSSAGDVDNDGKTDIIIGAPGGNYANLYYGNTLNKPLLVPDLSENDEEKGTPQLEFDSGVKTTGNTPGLSAADDGWDSWNGVYGYESGESPGSAVTYNGVNSIDSQEIADDDELIIYIGGNLGGGGFYGAKPDSGAYGVKFSVSSEMITAIESGAEAVLSYDWHFKNFGLDQDDTIWIKTFIRSNTKDYSLGWALDKDTVNNNNKDTTNEIHWSEIPEDINSIFVQGCSECFSTQDSYYLDIGAKVGDWYWEAGAYEDGGFYFDNLYLRINPAPDKQFIGPEESGFGFGVGYSDKLNMDDYGDIVISAPYYDSPNGNDSGAVFGFLTNPIFGKIQLAENAEFVTYGEHTGDNLGWTLLGVKSCDSDEFSEIITTAINYDYSAMTDVGRLYLLSISKGPRIRLLYPIGSEILSGNVTINAAVIDPDENIDNNEGVYFYYSSDTKLKDWIEIGRDNTPADENNIYEHYWDTSMLPDGTKYFVKAWVQDEDLHKGENISRAITIDNPHPPTIKILTPAAESNISGKVDIVAQIKDSVLDKIGGGIDYDRGVEFYFSDDMASWELLYVDHTKKWKETPDIYQTQIKLNDFPDGEYWIKVNATDWDGFEVEKTIKVNLNNRDREPSIKLITPNIPYQELSGTIPVKASAFDFDGNINSSGITYYMLSWELFILEQIEKWNKIGNAPEFEINLTGSHVYSYEFDTTLFKDGIYKLKAFVNDSSGLTNETQSIFVIIHNKQNNPPFIKLASPTPGRVLEITEFIEATVWDLENNIDDRNGVLFYYSTDKTHWKYLGNIPKPSEVIDVIQYYKYLWSTDTVQDGEYWLNVSVSDKDELTSWDVLDEPVVIHNRKTNPPIARFVAPTAGQYIKDTFEIQVYANDLEDKVDKLRVSLYIASDLKLEDWVSIASADLLNANDKLFGYSWDTTSFNDGKYWLKAVVLDTNDLETNTISDYFYIHNKLDNPPIVQFLGPHSGEVKGTIKLNASVFDLENNLDDNGVYFEYSTNPTDTKTWTLIGNDPTPKVEGLDNIYEIFWDTTTVPDNLYWLRARASDKTGLEGKGNSISYIIIHNNLNNPPILKLILPSKDVELTNIQTIKVEIIDFEDDVETVSFYYSKDQESWKPIESRININQEGNVYYYTTMWDTSALKGEIYLNIRAIDELGNSNQIIEGPFKTGRTDTDEGEGEKASEDYMLWIVIIVIVIIMVLAIVLLLQRSKRREEELIEEVAAEAQRSQVLEGEIISTPDMAAASMMGGSGAGEELQTYIPPQGLAPQPTAAAPQLPAYQPELDVETIESYKNQLNTWKMEGYNVSRLEQLSMTDEDMFARAFPIFSSNITRLKNISGKINTMDTTGYDAEVDSINSKLYEPDQALALEKEFKQLEDKIISGGLGTVPQAEGIDDILPQLLPEETTQQDTEGGSEPIKDEQVQNMVEPVQESDIPPDIDLPSIDQKTKTRAKRTKPKK